MEEKRITSVESLARWFHPELGSVPPDEFIKVAEENGYIQELGDWLLKEVCEQLREWDELGFQVDMVSVNISYEQLKSITFIPNVKHLLNTNQLEGNRFIFEVTERILVEFSDEVIERIDKLQSMGITLAVDDFGVGYSSLSYIQEFPIDYIKMDKIFVNQIPIPNKKLAIIRSMQDLSESLHISIVMEGIESIEQLKMVPYLSHTMWQGYLFSKPVSAAELQQDWQAIEQRLKGLPIQELSVKGKD